MFRPHIVVVCLICLKCTTKVLFHSVKVNFHEDTGTVSHTGQGDLRSFLCDILSEQVKRLTYLHKGLLYINTKHIKMVL